MTKFLRTHSNKYFKLGKTRKKKQKWRKPKGRDNKLREKRKGHHAIVSIGYRKKKQLKNLIKKEQLISVNNLKELENIQKDRLIILGKMGKKKKIEVVKKAKEKGIKIYKMNQEKFLNKTLKPKNLENEPK